MARKNISTAEDISPETGAVQDRDTTHHTSKLEQRVHPTQRRFRILPTTNSLVARDGRLPLFSPSAALAKERRTTGRPRATPARSATRQVTKYSHVSSPSSDSEPGSDQDGSIFCDGSDASSCSFEDDDRDAPVRWPAAEMLAASPHKTAWIKDVLHDFATLDLSNKENKPAQRPDVVLAQTDLFRVPVRPGDARKTPCSTPPTSPTKSRLNSPSKNRRLPTPPGRPSLDAFWSAEEINTWNDIHSPRKPVPSPTKRHQQLVLSTKPLLAEPSTPTKSPSKASPVRAPLTSPRKTKLEIAAQKSFDHAKDSLATAFLAILDERITNGEIGRRTESTGGVKLAWSKTLNSTAGRACWKREKIRKIPKIKTKTSACTLSSREPSPETAAAATKTLELQSSGQITIRHHATIELATKVITTEHRLYNTLAHEFCHLATYIISDVVDRPHGAEFKSWGAKCDTLFGEDKGVKVTTKHGYEIEWKYLWACSGVDAPAAQKSTQPAEMASGGGGGDRDATLVYDGGCGATYGRHSKSIDIARSRCSACRGRLVQIRPAPRGKTASTAAGEAEDRGAKASTKSAVTGFAAFVQVEFAAAKREMGPGVKHGAVMADLGRRWRARKEASASASVAVVAATTMPGEVDGAVDDVVELAGRVKEVVVIDDD